jgi:3D-(3,5/4)-trihydroxycyclohexane-1,2-dione acylhydrolase (decyclizing)
MKTRRLTMAQALVEFLKQQFVERDGQEHRLVRGIAGIFGHGNVAGLGQALEERGGQELPFMQPKNEQAMVHTAVAYAKTHLRLGALACTTSVGPGATNMVTGAATATINRLPVLLLPSDVFANRIPGPVLQQLESPASMDVSVNDCFRPVSRYWDRIQRPEQLLKSLPEAMRVLASPSETGAVTLCLPEDVQTEAWNYPDHFFARHVYHVERPLCDDRLLDEAVQWLQKAERPLLIAGGGVHYAQATQALQRLAEAWSLPVAVTQAGKGALPDAHEYCVGAIGSTGTRAANALAQKADVVIGVGTRYSDFTTASKSLFEDPEVRFVNVQINPHDAHKHGGLPLVGDARRILEALLQRLPKRPVSDSWQRTCHSVQHDWRAQRDLLLKAREGQGLKQSDIIRVLRDHMDEKATLVHAAGGVPGDVHKLWESRTAQDYHSEYGYSCMGYEIAGSLGVKLACPEREVYALVGDGGFLMLHTELVTSLQEGLKINVVLLDNGGYQCIHDLQRACGGRSFGNEFRSRSNGRLGGDLLRIDYATNAASLGAASWRVDTEKDLRAALEAAQAEKRSTLIHVVLRNKERLPGFAWWDVPMSEVSANAESRQARQEYEAARRKQRFYY